MAPKVAVLMTKALSQRETGGSPKEVSGASGR